MQVQRVSQSPTFQGTFLNNKAFKNLKTTLAATKKNRENSQFLEKIIKDIECIKDSRVFAYDSNSSGSCIYELIESKGYKKYVTRYSSFLENDYRYLFEVFYSNYKHQMIVSKP